MKTLLLTLLFPILSFADIKSATYEVPTSQTDLKAASVFNIEEITVNRLGDNLKIKYLVPEELTGVKNMIEFNGELKNNSGELKSPNGDLDCLVGRRQMMCRVQYQKLDFDAGLAKQLIQSKFQGPEQLNRIVIQERFSTDPIGVIRIYFTR